MKMDADDWALIIAFLAFLVYAIYMGLIVYGEGLQ